MCELLALSSDTPARLTVSLEALVAHGAAAGRTHDGWGVAFYQDRDVALFREPSAAGSSALVEFLETHGPASTLTMAHIRRATRGSVSLVNTQPFVRPLAGRMHVFAHNGDLPGIEAIAKLALNRVQTMGSTDSELAFCALLQRLEPAWSDSPEPPSLEARLDLISGFAADLRRLGPANFFYFDGEVLFAHGHRRLNAATGRIEPPGLMVLSRRCSSPSPVEGHQVPTTSRDVVLVASVSLSSENWRPLAEGEILAISGGRVIATISP